MAVLASVWVRAEQVTLAWDPNTESDLAGYKVHYGTASHSYTNSLDVHNVTTATVAGLSAGQTYFFAATAYNASGQESGYSNEVSYSVPAANGAPTTPSTPSGPTSGLVNTSLAFTAASTDPNGNVIEYRYDWGGGVIGTWGPAGQSHSWSAAGQYVVKAQARDSVGAESAWSAGKTVAIESPNSAPSAPTAPTASVANAVVGTAITFTTSATDPNANTIQYRYDWGGGILSNWGAASQSHSWSAAGQYTVKAQARDNLLAESAWSAGRTVTIESPNSAPSAPTAPTASVANAVVGTAITFSTSASDSNGDALQYRYDWGSGVLSSWGSASQSKSWSAAGQYTVKAQARDNLLAESAWSAGKTITIADPAPVVKDSDGDQVPDSQDAFPNDPSEWADADGNGIGDNADAAAASLVPEAPVLVSPVNQEAVSALAVLKTGPFKSAATGAAHAKTRWQVFRDEDDACVLDIQSATALVSLTVPKLVLDEGTAYFWRAQFVDANGKMSEWSDYEYFATVVSDSDLNINGIPDVQEVGSTIDLDKDGIRDSEQATIKSVKMEGTSVQIGVSIKDCPSALNVESVESEDPRLPDAYATSKPKRMPFGLINFKIAVAQPGDAATVRLHFSEQAPVRSKWYKYDPIADRWYDFSAYARFAADRRSVTLTLRDGGTGDADGIANGVIVDPAGVVEEDAAEPVSSDVGVVAGGDGSSATTTSGSSGGGGGGGCFISAAGDGAGSGWLAAAALVGLAWAVTRKRQAKAGV
jgi:hypothetical protein